MNKKLLTLAVGAALAMPMAAQAKVVVYGHAQVEIGNIEIDTGVGSTIADSDNNFSRDQARGRIGFKASEKLGNGMTAIAKFEFRTDTSDGNVSAGAGSLGSREHMVGLKGGFGTVELGRLKSPYKYMGGVTYDAFVATNLEARGNGGQSVGELGNDAFGHSSFLNNTIAWKSNNYGGVSIWVTLSIDEEAANATATSNAVGGDDGDYSIGVKYKSGPLEVGVVTINNDYNGTVATVGDADAVKIFGQYKIGGNHKLSASYEQLDTGAAVNGDTDVFFFGYQGRFGNNTFVAQVGNTDSDAAKGETDYFALGVIHHLSKKTRVFGGYRNTEVDAAGTASDAETNVFSVGLRVIF